MGEEMKGKERGKEEKRKEGQDKEDCYKNYHHYKLLYHLYPHHYYHHYYQPFPFITIITTIISTQHLYQSLPFYPLSPSRPLPEPLPHLYPTPSKITPPAQTTQLNNPIHPLTAMALNKHGVARGVVTSLFRQLIDNKLVTANQTAEWLTEVNRNRESTQQRLLRLFKQRLQGGRHRGNRRGRQRGGRQNEELVERRRQQLQERRRESQRREGQ